MTSCTIGIRLDPKSEVRVSSTGEVQILGKDEHGQVAVQINLGLAPKAWQFLHTAVRTVEVGWEQLDRARADRDDL